MELLLETDLPNLFYRGKVRDTYDLGDMLLMVATDRISAFDVVLPSGIPQKGVVLAQLSAFWFEKTAHLVPNHFIAMAEDREKLGAQNLLALLPPLPQDLARRAMVVRKAQRIDIECVVRGYLSGSAWAEYSQEGTVGGVSLPQGLRESQELPEPLFTPATKAETGHDENISFDEMKELVGETVAQELREKSLAIYRYASQYAQSRGLIIADTKMEFGFIDGQVALIDELLTPDSSRFWDTREYAPGGPQPSFDKQLARDWLAHSGWNKEPPAPPLPPEIVQGTSERYQEAYRRLTGKNL